ncbi:uncharacterized protein LY89DRAFT_369135 [Mollisia scopiformis]|uniref:Uncharacterized protein n=1 Tax=Mollisia scopiformis TaxID=149040 RepID=A0A132B433_MOLSC|nr:uncharacterized protein LY89DRAFT_369135 [Mollisia scopiformis]KUJ07146.1 hypothetical protein LY89DRAFT_369135 [Mollisia scopiformis]
MEFLAMISTMLQVPNHIFQDLVPAALHRFNPQIPSHHKQMATILCYLNNPSLGNNLSEFTTNITLDALSATHEALTRQYLPFLSELALHLDNAGFLRVLPFQMMYRYIINAYVLKVSVVGKHVNSLNKREASYKPKLEAWRELKSTTKRTLKLFNQGQLQILLGDLHKPLLDLVSVELPRVPTAALSKAITSTSSNHGKPGDRKPTNVSDPANKSQGQPLEQPTLPTYTDETPISDPAKKFQVTILAQPRLVTNKEPIINSPDSATMLQGISLQQPVFPSRFSAAVGKLNKSYQHDRFEGMMVLCTTDPRTKSKAYISSGQPVPSHDTIAYETHMRCLDCVEPSFHCMYAGLLGFKVHLNSALHKLNAKTRIDKDKTLVEERERMKADRKRAREIQRSPSGKPPAKLTRTSRRAGLREIV